MRMETKATLCFRRLLVHVFIHCKCFEIGLDVAWLILTDFYVGWKCINLHAFTEIRISRWCFTWGDHRACDYMQQKLIFLLGTCLLDPMPKTNRYHCAHLDSDKLNVCIVIKPSDKTENGLKMCQAALDISTIMHLLWLRQQESNGEQITWYEDSSTSTQEKALLFQIFFDEVNWQVTV